jgi:hypothetical protein
MDPNIGNRIWYSGESVCGNTKRNKARWIRKQRSINRLKTKHWLNRPVKFKELFESSHERILSPEYIKTLTERLVKARLAKKKPEPSVISCVNPRDPRIWLKHKKYPQGPPQAL